jgi:hypothetical protein
LYKLLLSILGGDQAPPKPPPVAIAPGPPKGAPRSAQPACSLASLTISLRSSLELLTRMEIKHNLVRRIVNVNKNCSKDNFTLWYFTKFWVIHKEVLVLLNSSDYWGINSSEFSKIIRQIPRNSGKLVLPNPAKWNFQKSILLILQNSFHRSAVFRGFTRNPAENILPESEENGKIFCRLHEQHPFFWY